jgi:iron complex transport system substrate-binding protein
MNLSRSRWALLLLASLIVACVANNSPTNPPSANSSSTASTQPQAAVKRVVTLSSLSTDIIHRLDRTKLVGVSGNKLTNDNPELAKLERVSEGQTPPNLEKIVALKPDLVIGAAGFHDAVLDKLKATGIRTIATEVNSWQALEDLTRQLASTIAADPEPLVQSYQSFLQPKISQPISALVLASNQPLLSPNKNSWAGDLLTQLGIQNVAADLQGESPMKGYLALSPEKLLQANPDVVILIDTPGGGVDKLKEMSVLKQLKATQNNRVYVLDYYGLINAGSIGAIEKASNRLKQEVFISGKQ